MLPWNDAFYYFFPPCGKDAIHDLQFLRYLEFKYFEAISLRVSNILINSVSVLSFCVIWKENTARNFLFHHTILYSCTLHCITQMNLKIHLESCRWAPLERVLKWFWKGCTTKEQVHNVWRRPRSALQFQVYMLNDVYRVLGSISGSLQIFNHTAAIHFPFTPNSLTTSVCANRATLTSTYVIPMECKVRMCLESLVRSFQKAVQFHRNLCISLKLQSYDRPWSLYYTELGKHYNF